MGAEQSDPNLDGGTPPQEPIDMAKAEATQPEPKPTQPRESLITKPAILGLVAALVLLGTLGVVLLFADNSKPATQSTELPIPAAQEPVTTLGASIAAIEGTVEYSSDGDTWIGATGGESLAHLDYVRTLDESRGIVLFDDGSVVRLDSNTELYLSSLLASEIEVTLVDGQVYSRVVESENRVFTVVTSNDRFEALGTAYKTATDGTKDELEVYQSTVKVTSADLQVSEGNKYDSDTKKLGEIDLSLLTEDEFAQWNKQKDSESEQFKDKLGVLNDKPKVDDKPAAPPTNSGQSNGIVLSGSKTDQGVKLSWSLSGVSSQQGFKLVRSKTDSTPTYSENEALYVSSSSARSSTWYNDNGGTHYYRICIYFEGTCSTYSNTVQVTSPLIEKEPVKSGGITLSIVDQQISWSLVGGTAPHGFKVVLDSSASPEYPENSIQYVSPGTTSATLPEKAAGTYYVRVCKYTNGTQDAGCVDYSNEVEYVVN